MHPQTATTGSDCLQPIKLLPKTVTLTVLLAATLCGCARSTKSFQQMTEAEQLNYLRAQADAAMLIQATNGVPHIHEVIEENADTFGESVGQWRGWVRLDYLDKSGGIQQTNIPMTFVASYDGRLFGRASGPGSGSALLNLE